MVEAALVLNSASLPNSTIMTDATRVLAGQLSARRWDRHDGSQSYLAPPFWWVQGGYRFPGRKSSHANGCKK